MRMGTWVYAPRSCGSIFTGHENTAVVANALGLVHGGEETRSDGNIARGEGFGFFV